MGFWQHADEHGKQLPCLLGGIMKQDTMFWDSSVYHKMQLIKFGFTGNLTQTKHLYRWHLEAAADLQLIVPAGTTERSCGRFTKLNSVVVVQIRFHMKIFTVVVQLCWLYKHQMSKAESCSKWWPLLPNMLNPQLKIDCKSCWECWVKDLWLLWSCDMSPQSWSLP